MKRIALGLVCLAFAGRLVAADSPPAAAPAETKVIAGWNVLVSDALREKDREATEQALRLLERQLDEVVRVVPVPARTRLQKVRLWLSPEYAGIAPHAEYHPDAGWLRENQRNPAMAKGIEFTNIRIFDRETKRMPNFALHELAHAYHDQVLPQGFDNPDVKAAFEKAKAAGLYDQVEQRFGDGRSATVRAYAMTNPQEYFAETSEAFFSTNDFFPFNRDQLARHDPQMFDVLKKLWGQSEAAK